MLQYLYDGSLDGFLCCIKTAIDLNDHPDFISNSDSPEEALFIENRIIPSMPETAHEFAELIRRKYSREVFQKILYGFLSEVPGIEIVILEYYRHAEKRGNKVNQDLMHPAVGTLVKLTQKVGFEAHRLKGLIRFQKLWNGIYYSQIEPDHHVLNLLIPHFTQRLRNQNWIIHDTKRNLAVIYQNRQWKLVELEKISSEKDLLAPEEKELQQLWKAYFKTIAITERKNPKLQKRLMPVRYWKYLIEMEKIDNVS